MTANDRFFQTKQAAAVLKHGILSRYPTVFASMTGSTNSEGRVVYLDGYAGPGRYEPEGEATEAEPGSPLIAIRTAETVKAWQRKLHCVFVERNKAYAANLQVVLDQEAASDLMYEVRQGDVEENLDHVLATAKSLPLFAFLDPFGTALPYDALRSKLLGRDRGLSTEVLLNFSVQSVSRIGGLLTGDEEDDEKTGSGRSATLARMDAFLGGAWWQDEFRQARLSDEEGSAARAALHVVEQFQVKVQRDTGFGSFPVPIRRKPDHHPLFVMLLFFRHQVAPYVFNDAVSKANEEWRRYRRDIELAELLEAQNAAPGLFDTADLQESEVRAAEKKLDESWVDVIADNIRRHVAAGPLPVAAQVSDIYGKTLGLAREMHLHRAWDRLAEEGVVLPRKKPKEKKTRDQRIYPVSR